MRKRKSDLMTKGFHRINTSSSFQKVALDVSLAIALLHLPQTHVLARHCQNCTNPPYTKPQLVILKNQPIKDDQ